MEKKDCWEVTLTRRPHAAVEQEGEGKGWLAAGLRRKEKKESSPKLCARGEKERKDWVEVEQADGLKGDGPKERRFGPKKRNSAQR